MLRRGSVYRKLTDGKSVLWQGTRDGSVYRYIKNGYNVGFERLAVGTYGDSYPDDVELFAVTKGWGPVRGWACILLGVLLPWAMGPLAFRLSDFCGGTEGILS